MLTKKEVLDNIDQVKEYINEIENAKETKKIGITIRNRFTGDIIFESEKTTYKDAINEYCANARSNGNRADLTRADLTGANLTGANLTRADLTDANLTRADLTGANLTGANLTRADLTGANLTGANLTRADLTRADLTGANLTRANLTDADLTACLFYMGNSNENFQALCKAIKTIKWNSNTGSDFVK